MGETKDETNHRRDPSRVNPLYPAAPYGLKEGFGLHQREVCGSFSPCIPYTAKIFIFSITTLPALSYLLVHADGNKLHDSVMSRTQVRAENGGICLVVSLRTRCATVLVISVVR